MDISMTKSTELLIISYCLFYFNGPCRHGFLSEPAVNNVVRNIHNDLKTNFSWTRKCICSSQPWMCNQIAVTCIHLQYVFIPINYLRIYDTLLNKAKQYSSKFHGCHFIAVDNWYSSLQSEAHEYYVKGKQDRQASSIWIPYKTTRKYCNRDCILS